MLCFLHRLRKTVLWIFYAIVGLSLIFVMLNSADSPLDPAAEAARRASAQIDPADNLLHAIYGFDISGPVASAADMAQLGQTVITRARAGKTPFQYPSSEEIYAGLDRLKAPDIQALCSASSTDPGASCLQYIRSHRKFVESLVNDNAELIRRYRMLRTMPRDVFDLPPDPTVILPSWGSVLTSQRLLLAQIGLRELDQDQKAVEELLADLSFWRHDLAERPSLLGKMIAVAGMRRSLIFTGELLRSGLLKPDEIEALRDQLKPLTSAERTLGPALYEEYRFREYQFDLMKNQDRSVTDSANEPRSPWSAAWSRIENFFFLPNATTNRDFRFTQELIAHDALPCSRQKDDVLSIPDSELKFYDHLRNPVGNMLLLVSAPYYQNYIQRACNLDGLVRLVGLQAMIRHQQIADKEIGNFVGRAGPEYADPYTTGPMRWEPQRGLSFEPRGRDERMRDLLPWPI